jgi:GAF domain-containing protein
MSDEPANANGANGANASDAAADAQLGQALRRLLATVASAETLLPREERADLLTLIVRTAARVVSARAASLFLIDDAGTHLDFAVAIGPKADEVRKHRVPIGVGIAGTVAATGQPIAISAPEQDPRFASEIARSIDHIPTSILCVPLRHGETTLGVLEALDKEGRDTFTADDIELLAYFAEIAALATEHARRRDDLRAALIEIVTAWTASSADADAERLVRAGIDAVLESARSGPAYRAALELAELVANIAAAGAAEQQLCRDWLSAFARYTEASARPLLGTFPWSP